MGGNSRRCNTGPRSSSPDWDMRGEESVKWTKHCFYTDTLEFNDAMDRDECWRPSPWLQRLDLARLSLASA
jgi:hypothetical protein